MTNPTHRKKPKTILELCAEVVFSIGYFALQRAVQSGSIGTVVGTACGLVLAIFPTTRSNMNVIGVVYVAMAAGGFIGVVIGGIIGLGGGILKVYREGQLYNLYVYFMVWLGAAPPLEYEHLWSDQVELGFKIFLLKASFWLAFWAVEGALLGALGGVLFGIFGFYYQTVWEAIFIIVLTTISWTITGAVCMVMTGPYLWLTSKILQKHKLVGGYGEIPFLLAGGGIGRRLFKELFGDDENVRDTHYV